MVATAPKSKVTLKLIRDGKQKTVTATLGTLPGELSANADDNPTSPPSPRVIRSMEWKSATSIRAHADKTTSPPTCRGR